MKKSIIITTILVAASMIALSSCNDEYDDVAPGNYVDTQRIETFPGDTVLVTGQVTNGSPIQTVSLVCEAWDINQVYDRTMYEDNVFNYRYHLAVPTDATFNQTLTVSVVCENGLSTIREIPITYLPDTSAPAITSTLNAQESVNFDTETGNATWDLAFTVADDRQLKSASITIPAVAYNEEIELTGKTATIERSIQFTEVGSFPCSITLADASENISVTNVELVVMFAEVEDPIQDYPGMYVVDANENPDDYIDGYYRYMDRQGEYQYQGAFYAATDNAQLYFTPERSLDGDLYGVSPYVSSKLMNRNGYVVPVTIEQAGYYGIWIDLNAHTYSIWPLEISADTYTGALRMSGTGFTFGDWGLPEDDMTKLTDYRYEYHTSIVEGYAGDIQYYFYSPDWVHIFRADTEGKWWFESASGSCVTFRTEYSGNVVVTFDTASPWGTIKKAN